MNQIDKLPSISNTIIRRSSSFDDSGFLLQIKRFLIEKKRRSMSDNSLLPCRPEISRQEKQVKTVVNPSIIDIELP